MAIISTAGRKKSEATLDATSESTDWVLARKDDMVSFSVAGAALDGIYEIQRSFDGGTTAATVESWTVNGAAETERDVRCAATCLYRILLTTRNSGSIVAIVAVN
jgi:hypothetical protein